MTLRISFLIALLAFSGSVFAQKIEVARRQDVEKLLSYGFGAKDVVAWLGEEGRRIEIDAADIRELERQEVPAEVISWLEKRLPETSKKKLDVAGVIEVWKKDQDEKTLLAAVAAADRDWLLEPSDVLALDRARVPAAVIARMNAGRSPDVKKRPSAKEVSVDDVVRMTTDKRPESEILALIEAAPNDIDIDEKDLLPLKRDGVSTAVLQALWRKRKTAPVVGKTNDEKPVSVEGESTPRPIELEIHRDSGIGYSMLLPRGWVISKEYKSVKALVQMVDPEGATKEGEPDLEMSVMKVAAKGEGAENFSALQLDALAGGFVESLKAQFARDGISVVTEKPEQVYISGERAIRIETQARVNASGTSYRGACHLLYSEKRIWVVSYSVRLENSARWLPLLERCVRSFALDDETPLQLDPESDQRRDEVAALFTTWRRSLRTLDFETFRKLYVGKTDELSERRKFLELVTQISDGGKRVEVAGVDFNRSVIVYNIWSEDGRGRGELLFKPHEGDWRLLR